MSNEKEVAIVPEFREVIEKTFEKMENDFNDFRNSAKNENVKGCWLTAITDLRKTKASVLRAVDEDLQSRRMDNITAEPVVDGLGSDQGNSVPAEGEGSGNAGQ